MSKLANFEDVIAYVKYIKDISHELSISSDVEKVLITNKSRGRKRVYGVLRSIGIGEIKDNAYILMDDSLRQLVNIATRVYRYGLFLGIGCLYGKVDNRVIGAPLLLMELEIDENENKLNLTDSIFVNYKLISTLIGYYDDFDVEEVVQSVLRDETISKLVDSLEELLEKGLKDYKFSELAERCFEIINSSLNLESRFKTKKETITELLERKQVEKLNSQIILDVNALYILALDVPHEVSVFNSIKLLEEELKEKGRVQNELINTLMHGLFHRKVESIYPDEEQWRELESYIEKYLPLTLSHKQKEALLKALTSKISYIQGPPGTGKSYTITAIAMLGILKGLKVLIVSSKEPAVKVVAEKLEPFLRNEMGFLPFIHVADGVRNRLREEIGRLLGLPRNDLNSKQKQTLKVLEDLEREIDRVYMQIKELEERVEYLINLNVEYIKLSRDLENLRRYFENNYYAIREDGVDIKRENIRVLKAIKSYLKNLTKDDYILPLSQAIFYYSALSLLYKFGKPILSKDFYRYYIRTPEFLDLAIEVYERYAKILEHYANLNRFDINTTKKNLKKLKHRLEELDKEYIKAKNNIRLFESLLKEDIRQELNKFSRLLYYTNKDRIAELRKNIRFEKLLEVYPVWICETRKINELLPMVPEVFDLVVIDEASQVNLPEILPVIYRCKKLCVVGDHKQLSLISTGLPLNLSLRFDEITWNRYRPGGMSYSEGRNRNLTVTKSSILDLITSEEKYITVPQTTLNEHFRSLPALAEFVSRTFYEDKLVIMTKTPDKINLLPNNLYPVRVSGKRDKVGRYVPEEAEEVVSIIESLRKTKAYGDVDLSHIFREKEKFSIGVISPIRNQIEFIRNIMDARGLDFDNVFLGTPEEAQGHEFDVAIITLSAGESASKQHYENPNRFNVMVSRAKYFTFFVYSDIPMNFSLTRRYLSHFGYNLDNISVGQKGYLTQSTIRDLWKFDENRFESEFERMVYYQLKAYADRRNGVKIYNQVESCGRRLDFVLYNENNHKFVAVEVDGIYHFREDNPREYNRQHIERMEQLMRAGWNIINTQYYKWFDKYGRLLPQELVKNEVERIYRLLDEHLGFKNDSQQF